MKINWIVLVLSLFIFTKIKSQNLKTEKDSCAYFYMIQFEGIENKPFTKDVQSILCDIFRSSPTFREETKNFIVISKQNVEMKEIGKLVPNKLIYFRKLDLSKEYINELESIKEEKTEDDN